MRVAMLTPPAHGHVNPMLPLAERLVAGGAEVTFAATAEFAAAVGATPEPALVREVEIAVDCADPAALQGVWAQALGYREAPDGYLVDPWRRGPAVWFQRTDTPAPSRVHLDAYLPPETAEEVLERVRAAGGALLDSRFAPSWWVVADADGNRLCVCTPMDPPPDAPLDPSPDAAPEG